MAAMNGLMKLPEISETMKGMAQEMERAGIIEEMIDDTFAMTEVHIQKTKLLVRAHIEIKSHTPTQIKKTYVKAR